MSTITATMYARRRREIMAAEGNFKIVDYSEDAQYGCHNCKYRELAMTEEPCETCVTECVNIDSHKPVKWEEAK